MDVDTHTLGLLTFILIKREVPLTQTAYCIKTCAEIFGESGRGEGCGCGWEIEEKEIFWLVRELD